MVLKVNGDNTLFPEETVSDDRNAWKWILGPKDKIEVTGFQTTNKVVKTFEVSPVQPSDASVVRYNPHAGAFQVVVYRAMTAGDAPPMKKAKPVADAVFIGRGFPPVRTREDSLKTLQGLLRENRTAPGGSARGYVVPGGETHGLVKQVPFKAFGEPGSLTITYYAPERK